MLAGMVGFVLFCEAIALLVVRAGVPLAFAVASLLALSLQLLMLNAARPRDPRDGRADSRRLLESLGDPRAAERGSLRSYSQSRLRKLT